MNLHPKQLDLSKDLSFAGGNIKLASGRILIGDGSESQPGLAFTNDEGTGLFLAQSGEIAISAGANAFVYLKDDGTVEMTGTTGIAIQAGSTAERPSTPLAGLLRFNLETLRLETYVNQTWESLAHRSDLTPLLRLDGTRAMTGSLNMGTQPITNAGTINDVVIQSHAGRHQPGGADALPTASAIGLSLSSTNTEGTSTSFARADHTHVITGVQPQSAILSSIGDQTVNGYLVRTAAGTVTTRAITGTVNTVSVTNGTGVAGTTVITLANNPVVPGNASLTVPVGTSAQRPGTLNNGMLRYNTDISRFEVYRSGSWFIVGETADLSSYQPLASNLTAVAGITTNGLVVRTESTTATTRSISGTDGRITVVNGDGIAGNPTIDMAPGIVNPGSYSRVSVDTYGRVVGGTFSFVTYYATRFDSPMTTGSWPIKAQAAAYLDPNHSSMTIRGFDDTTPEGVGISSDVPAGAVSCNVILVGRARSAPTTTQSALWSTYFHSYPIGTLAPDWGPAIALNPITIAARNVFLYQVSTNITVAQMGLTSGAPFQMEIVRNANAAGDTLVGDFLLFYARLDWQAA